VGKSATSVRTSSSVLVHSRDAPAARVRGMQVEGEAARSCLQVLCIAIKPRRCRGCVAAQQHRHAAATCWHAGQQPHMQLQQQQQQQSHIETHQWSQRCCPTPLAAAAWHPAGPAPRRNACNWDHSKGRHPSAPQCQTSKAGSRLPAATALDKPMSCNRTRIQSCHRRSAPALCARRRGAAPGGMPACPPTPYLHLWRW
jgi:hypothetical protein